MTNPYPITSQITCPADGVVRQRLRRGLRTRGLSPTDVPGARVRLACLAITSQTAGATVGLPFTAAGSLRDGRYAWRHPNLRPAEGASGSGISVALSDSCWGS